MNDSIHLLQSLEQIFIFLYFNLYFNISIIFNILDNNLKSMKNNNRLMVIKMRKKLNQILQLSLLLVLFFINNYIFR